MRRRQFLALVGGVVAQPLAVRAQQVEPAPLVGVLMASTQSSPEYKSLFAAFDEGLRTLGWKGGENVTIETRWGGFDADLTKQAAKDLVALRPNVLVSSTTPTTEALADQTRTIPIVL